MSGAGSHQPIGLTIGSVVFAGGGTGGHIFPALAIAEAIGALPEGQSIRRVMIGSDKDLDRALLKAATERGELENTAGIPARPFGVRPKQAWRLISTWGTCVRETRMLLRDERERTNTPPVLVAMGGYVRAAPVKAALAEKCPVVLVNLDAVHGKANRWIAARAGRRLAVGRAAGQFEPLASEPINSIVRAALHDRPTPKAARQQFGLDPDRPTLLITGGSQGARTINAFITKYAGEHATRLLESGWQILHQIGADDVETVGALYAHVGVRAECRPFLDDIAAARSAADARVCRAGAGTVAEAWATATPSLFLPYPFHKDAHQRVNAAMLTDRGAGMLGDDRIETEANLALNGPLLDELLHNTGGRERIRDMLAALGPADGAETVARAVTAMLG